MESQFELAVRDVLFQNLSLHDGSDKIAIHHRRKYVGLSSGHEHEIDLSFELDVVGTRVLVLVECKEYQRAVGIDDLMEFASRIMDIGAHKGIVVTTRAFQRGAVRFARSRGIALVVLKGRRHWNVIFYLTEPAVSPTATHSLRHFCSAGTIVQQEQAATIQLAPLNTINYLDPVGPFSSDDYVAGTKETREYECVLQIVWPGGQCADFGEIVLYRAKAPSLAQMSASIARRTGVMIGWAMMKYHLLGYLIVGSILYLVWKRFWG